MPDFTMASAMPRTSSSLTSHPNLFQVLNHIGGVSAKAGETGGFCANAVAVRKKIETVRIRIRRLMFIFIARTVIVRVIAFVARYAIAAL